MFPETALVTGAAGGIGRELVALLEAEGAEVRGVDLADGFDVSRRSAWDAVEPAELVCLNAGVLAAGDGSEADYRRILGANVDGVVFGVQALTPRMRPGSAFVVTSSLAGLIPMESDPLYSLTKHAVVGFARSVAPGLEARGIRINLVCPGIARTAMTEAAAPALDAAGLPAAGAARGRRGDPGGGPQRADRPGVGRPAGPGAGAVPVPERPRPEGRGRRGNDPAAHLTVPKGRSTRPPGTWTLQQFCANSRAGTVPAARPSATSRV